MVLKLIIERIFPFSSSFTVKNRAASGASTHPHLCPSEHALQCRRTHNTHLSSWLPDCSRDFEYQSLGLTNFVVQSTLCHIGDATHGQKNCRPHFHLPLHLRRMDDPRLDHRLPHRIPEPEPEVAGLIQL